MHSEYRPAEAGVAFAVKLGKGQFVGRDAIEKGGSEPGRRLCCLRLSDPRQIVLGKEPVIVDGSVAGYVTSAGFGYSVGESLAYTYLPAASAVEGVEVCIGYFGESIPATVVAEPRWDPEGTRLRQ
jgi:glycine cleavage system aminomethyltransferase T